jgi:hypothetical protein
MKRLEMSNKPNNVRREVHPNQSTDLPMQKMGMTDQFEVSTFRHWNKHPPEAPSLQGHPCQSLRYCCPHARTLRQTEVAPWVAYYCATSYGTLSVESIVKPWIHLANNTYYPGKPYEAEDVTS